MTMLNIRIAMTPAYNSRRAELTLESIKSAAQLPAAQDGRGPDSRPSQML
jgi:hypothetical protein